MNRKAKRNKYRNTLASKNVENRTMKQIEIKNRILLYENRIG